MRRRDQAPSRRPPQPGAELGDVEKGVLPRGWIAAGEDLGLYYGASENDIALATAKIPALLNWLGAHNSLEE